MKRTNYGYIYLTTNLINGKMYVGQHRAKTHEKWYKGGGKILRKSIIKYGKSNFKNEILCWCRDKEELNLAEINYIELYRIYYPGRMYNIDDGGYTPTYRIGKPRSEETKLKLRIANLGKKHSDETKQKCSIASKKKTITTESIEKGRLKRIGQKRTTAQKELLSKIHTGMKMSEITKKRMSVSHTGLKHNMSKEGSDKLSRLMVNRRTHV